jgi:hypothetical protein
MAICNEFLRRNARATRFGHLDRELLSPRACLGRALEIAIFLLAAKHQSAFEAAVTFASNEGVGAWLSHAGAIIAHSLAKPAEDHALGHSVLPSCFW